MTKPGSLTQLHVVDPVTHEELLRQVPAAARAELRERILATPRGHGLRVPARSRTRRRVAIGSVAAATVAVVLVAVSLIGPGRPGSPAGPAVASASELLRQTATVARSEPDYVLTGTQRVYAGYLLDSREDVVSGEWWVAADGSYLARTRTYSGGAARALGTPIGESDLVRSDKPTKGDGQPKQWTYAQLRDLPTDRAGLTRWIDAEVARTPLSPDAPESATNPTARTLATALDLVTQRLAPPTLRAAGLDVIAALPGVVRLGTATDRVGRTGELIGVPSRFDSSVQDTLLVEPRSGTLLESASGVVVVSAPASPRPGYNGPTGSATFGSTVRTYVGPTVVGRELVVPAGVSVAPRTPTATSTP